jgi:hypothetical protein
MHVFINQGIFLFELFNNRYIVNQLVHLTEERLCFNYSGEAVANHFVILERLAKKIQQGDNLEIRDFRSEESFRIRFQIDISPSPSLLR